MLAVCEGYLGCGGVPKSKLCAARTRPVPNFDAKTWTSGEGNTDHSRAVVSRADHQMLYIIETCVAWLEHPISQLCAIPRHELDPRAQVESH